MLGTAPSASTKDEYSLEKVPNLYNRVSDTYGPSVFLAWILVAYTIAAQIGQEKSPSIDMIKRDLVITISYLIAVAIHLVLQVARFPGPRKEIWTTTEEQLVPYAAAIWASALMCRIALAMNTILAFLFLHFGRSTEFVRKSQEPLPKKRFWLLGVSSLWISVALCFESFPGSQHGVGIFGAGQKICGAAYALFVTPLLLWVVLHILISLIASLYQPVRGVGVLTSMEVFALLGTAFLSFLSILFVVCVNGWVGFEMWSRMLPKSGHPVLELGQALALVGGCINAAFSLRNVVKRRGRKYWAAVWKDATKKHGESVRYCGGLPK
ncbi:hypothetical protein BU26DRAFT_566262 [Trematosphaeria pertusa]|uniref:Uncharacterized protein n=1 Tax=Trematosphaeria pertusa TaxID=390896 RepID=A0A6A6IA59_9PLEO|nr:uncharacterized protein BU26DRAFT_566262 [Trematosphaeria pertusa]KAF2247276.1 hypothetical protein BU26DRAFT_566262 [Trematosphaeria pertusa]